LLFEELDTAFDWGIGRDYTSSGAQAVPTEAVTKANEGSTLSLSGLLSCLDWAAAAKAQFVLILRDARPIYPCRICRLLFTTTNHVERIDPVLSRPGRIDIWVNFTNATKWQAEHIFKSFFPSALAVPTPNDAMHIDICTNNHSASTREASVRGGPTLEEAEISQLAKWFADAIPEGKMSVWPSIPTRIVSILRDNICRLLA
jgi:chaperone BCS1